jgi:hypothetical protein
MDACVRCTVVILIVVIVWLVSLSIFNGSIKIDSHLQGLISKMASTGKVFTLDDLLYYVNFSASLHCSPVITSQIVHSLSADLVAQNIVSQDMMDSALKRNEITVHNPSCNCCKIVKPADPLLVCRGCSQHVHSMCFWKPGAFCSRRCKEASESAR